MTSASGPAPGDAELDRLIDANDLDGLIRRIQALCDDADWDGLRRLRDRARAASGSGRQLWPAADHAEHRLALEADAAHAGPVVSSANSQFAIGPLTEVAASSHTWDELAPHLAPGPARALVAYERVLRGEDLRADRSIDTSVFDLPLVLAPWEPAYPVATYEPWRGIFPPPRPLPPLRPVALPVDSRPFADPAATDALAELTRPWTAESNGRADAVAVQGDHLDALAALGLTYARVAPLPPAAALEIMAWTSASGGAHGRRRGMAAGRFNAWWTVATLTGLAEDWPPTADELGRALRDLAFFAWDSDEGELGWSFRLAIVDTINGVAWAAMANDSRLE
jgi:hypothetical protein